MRENSLQQRSVKSSVKGSTNEIASEMKRDGSTRTNRKRSSIVLFLVLIFVVLVVLYSELASTTIEKHPSNGHLFPNSLPSPPPTKNPFTASIPINVPISKLSVDEWSDLLCSGASIKNFSVFVDTLEESLQVYNQIMNNATLWLNNKMPVFQWRPFFALEKTFQPFVQRVILNEESVVGVWGDLHGSDCALSRTLAHFKNKSCLSSDFKLKQNCYAVFLGDFGDRGPNGMEVLYTLLTLKIRNPNQVFLVRGNHEDEEVMMRWGLMNEFWVKSRNNLPLNFGIMMNYLFDHLPAALYIGLKDAEDRVNWLQFSHGSYELGYNPHDFLNSSVDATVQYESITSLRRFYYFNRSLENDIILKQGLLSDPMVMQQLVEGDMKFETPFTPVSFGLMWNDFLVHFEPWRLLYLLPSRGFAYHQDLLIRLLKYASNEPQWRLRGVFRAHQHNDMLGPMLQQLIYHHGIVHMQRSGLWSSEPEFLFCNFLSAPQAGITFPYDSYGILGFKKNYAEWTLDHYWKLHSNPLEPFSITSYKMEL